jgi:hypothetical protein
MKPLEGIQRQATAILQIGWTLGYGNGYQM